MYFQQLLVIEFGLQCQKATTKAFFQFYLRFYDLKVISNIKLHRSNVTLFCISYEIFTIKYLSSKLKTRPVLQGEIHCTINKKLLFH